MCHQSPSERSHLLSRRDSDSEIKPGPAGSTGQCAEHTDTASNASGRTRSGLYVILLGQSIALALSCANAASSTLENYYQIRVPTFQTGLVYLLLSFHLVYLFWRHRIKGGDAQQGEEIRSCQEMSDGMQHLSIEDADAPVSCKAATKPFPAHTFPFTRLPLHTPWYIYLLLATLDVEANYLAMLSFQHTSLSSSMLLTSLSVLSTVLLRQLIFPSARYSGKRLIGVFICLVGGCLWLREEFYRGGVVEADRDLADTNATRRDVIHGDLLALAAACLYGLNDVCAEYFVKTNNDRVEYLGMLGFFGSIVSFAIQVPLLEKEGVQELIANLLDINGNASNSMTGAIFLLLGFVVLLCYFYTSVMAFLSIYDSTILNLSFQSCPLWAVILTMVQKSLTKENGGLVATPPAMFFVSLIMVVAGMFLYERHSGDERRDTKGGSNAIVEDRCIEIA